MHKGMTATIGCLLLTACGDGGSGAGGSVAVVTGAATPAPTPTPTPTPTATVATSSYQRYADLTGDRTFATACASLVGTTGLPTPQPAAAFGDALTLGYTAATGGWSIGGDGVSVGFAATDAVTAAAGQKSYAKALAGSTQRLTIIDPAAAGSTLFYTRALALRADRTAGSTLYSCIFGVPTLPADLPATATTYAAASVAGTAMLLDANGAVATYALSSGTGTIGIDAAGKVTVTVHLLGNLQTANGTASATTDLGTFTGTGKVESARVRFSGALDSSDRVSLFSSFSGAFFGGAEAGAAFEVLAADPNTGARVAATGTIAAAR